MTQSTRTETSSAGRADPARTPSTLSAKLSFESWEEDPPFGPDAAVPRLAQARVTYRYTGGFEGTGTCRNVLHYRDEMAGTFVGLELVEGRVGGEEGSFVLRHEGTFGGTGVESRSTVVPGTGTGAFAGLAASGHHHLPHGTQEWDWRLDPA